MNRTAGIKPLINIDNTFLGEIKQSILLFDLIGIPSLDAFVFHHRLKKHKPNCEHAPIINELLYLQENDLVFSTKIRSVTLKSGKDYSDLNKEFEYLHKIYDDESVGIDLRLEAGARINALILNNENAERDFDSIPLIKNLSLKIDNQVSKIDVVNLIIEHMPIPDDQTPWENILEFKNNPDNKGKMAGLRLWVNKSLKSKYSISELKDELEYLTYQYTKRLEIHKIKYNSGLLQTFVVGSAELLENTVKLKFSNIAKGLFSATNSKADLLNLELTAPGNELSYIYQANKTFNK